MIDRGYTPEKVDLNKVLNRENVALKLGLSESLEDFPDFLWPVVDEAIARTREDFGILDDDKISEFDLAIRNYGTVMCELAQQNNNMDRG